MRNLLLQELGNAVLVFFNIVSVFVDVRTFSIIGGRAFCEGFDRIARLSVRWSGVLGGWAVRAFNLRSASRTQRWNTLHVVELCGAI